MKNKYFQLTVFLFIIFFAPVSVARAATTLFETAVNPNISIGWGGNSGTVIEKVAVRYVAPANQSVCTVSSKVTRGGTYVTSSAILNVREGGSTPEGGTLLATTSLASSSFSIGFPNQYVTFTLPACLPFTANQVYWFTFEPSPEIPFRVLFSANYVTAGRASDEFSYSSAWQLNGSAFLGGRQWVEVANKEWSLKLEGSDAKQPVIIVPGILGSELYDGQNLIWPDLGQMLADENDEFLPDTLSLDINGDSIKNITTGSIVEKLDLPATGIPVKKIFQDLILDLKSAGYASGTDYFFFPYDWRLDLDDAMVALHAKIEAVKAKTGFSKVNIIAHSMGGLLAEDYINAHGKASVDRLIFIGTPHLGAPKAAKTILFGDRFGIPWLEGGAMQEIAKNAPAVYQLLPNSKYFEQFTGYLKPSGYAPDAAPIDYNSTKTFLGVHAGNPGLVNAADNFFGKGLYNLDLSGIKVYNFVGCDEATQAGYQLTADNTEVESVKYTSGDKTVPMVSADYLVTDNKYYVRDSDHAELPSASEIRSATIEILGDKPVILTGNDISTSSSICNFQGKEMLWRSPVDVHVYDQAGNHTGPVADNVIEYNVPGVDYEIIGHRKFIFLPTDTGQIYNVVGQGTDAGSFDLILRDNDNGNATDTAFFNNVPITNQSAITLSIADGADNQTILVDRDGGGQPAIVSTVTPSSTIADIERMYSAGHIGKKTVKQSLIQNFKSIIKIEKRIVKLTEKDPKNPKQAQKITRMIEKSEERIDKILARTLLKNLEKNYKKDSIDDVAYNIIKEDIEWLINH